MILQPRILKSTILPRVRKIAENHQRVFAISSNEEGADRTTVGLNTGAPVVMVGAMERTTA